MIDVIGALANEGHKGPAPASEAARPSLYRGVVIDVIHDISILDEKQLFELSNSLKNKQHLVDAPRNSCIVKIVSGNESKISNKDYTVCFPFFPPYLCMPVKPGEHVWVFIEDPANTTSTALGYWICRISESLHIDDVNFTHSDRAFSTPAEKIADISKDAQTSENISVHRGLGFPNGIGIPAGFRLADEDGYEKIYSGSIGMQSVTLEPVPRFTKRPGDLVLQGSNNTCIVLGEDRGWNRQNINQLSEAEWSNATNTGATTAQKFYSSGKTPYSGSPPADGVANPNDRQFAGTIDVVVGRGRYLPAPEENPELTACRVIVNSRSYEETDKNPVLTGKTNKKYNRLDTPIEGDPDFLNDASRIYVSMNTLPDFNFSLDYPKVPVPGNSNEGLDVQFPTEKVDGSGQAAIVLKSDEIRIVARQDLEKDPQIQGSITLIKEGVPDDENGQGRAIITIRPDGVIMIDGPKIVVGSGIEKANGRGNQVAVGLGATEPMVLGDILDTRLQELANTVIQYITSTAAATQLGLAQAAAAAGASADASIQASSDSNDAIKAYASTISAAAAALGTGLATPASTPAAGVAFAGAVLAAQGALEGALDAATNNSQEQQSAAKISAIDSAYTSAFGVPPPSPGTPPPPPVTPAPLAGPPPPGPPPVPPSLIGVQAGILATLEAWKSSLFTTKSKVGKLL